MTQLLQTPVGIDSKEWRTLDNTDVFPDQWADLHKAIGDWQALIKRYNDEDAALQELRQRMHQDEATDRRAFVESGNDKQAAVTANKQSQEQCRWRMAQLQHAIGEAQQARDRVVQDHVQEYSKDARAKLPAITKKYKDALRQLIDSRAEFLRQMALINWLENYPTGTLQAANNVFIGGQANEDPVPFEQVVAALFNDIEPIERQSQRVAVAGERLDQPRPPTTPLSPSEVKEIFRKQGMKV
jgi:hypothetical protein